MSAWRLAAVALLAGMTAGGGLQAAPPEVTLEGWKEAFKADPALFALGVHPVEKPESAFIATGRLPLEAVSLETDRDRDIAAKRVELAAKRQLLEFFFRRDKEKLRLPPHLERFANEALKFEAHSRTLIVQGLQTAARWKDDKYIWCTVVVSRSNVKRAGAFAEQFRSAGAAHYLQRFGKEKAEADLFRAFEIQPDAKEVREALAQYFLTRGHRVAAFVVQTPRAQLPPRDDPLGKYLAGLKNPAWEEAMAHFEAEKPRLDQAAEAFLRALETRYVHADAFNYLGACYRERGWPRLASVFFAQALAQSEGGVHPYALTNLGLCLVDLDQPEAAAPYLRKAVEKYPDEEWTARARKALKDLESRKSP
jgi:Tfp pilus assembly protein PilF